MHQRIGVARQRLLHLVGEKRSLGIAFSAIQLVGNHVVGRHAENGCQKIPQFVHIAGKDIINKVKNQMKKVKMFVWVEFLIVLDNDCMTNNP